MVLGARGGTVLPGAGTEAHAVGAELQGVQVQELLDEVPQHP